MKEFSLIIDEVYPFATFKNEWKKLSKFGFAMALMLWNAKLADKEKITNVEDYDPNELNEMKPLEIRDDLKDTFWQIIKDLVLHFHENDFL